MLHEWVNWITAQKNRKPLFFLFVTFFMASVVTASSPPPTAVFSLTINQGWNLVSVPLVNPVYVSGCDYSYTQDVGTRLVLKVIHFNGTGYENLGPLSRVELKPGLGYWVYSLQACTVQFTGTGTFQEYRNKPLQGGMNSKGDLTVAGWNQIGSLSQTANFDQVKNNCNFNRGPYEYTNGQYHTTSSLQPGKAYWIYTEQNCQLNGPAQTTPTPTATASTPTPTPASFLCPALQGNPQSPFKVYLLDNAQAPFFEDHKNQIIEEFQTISPFKEHFGDIAFYELHVPTDEKISCSQPAGDVAGIMCDYDAVDTYIKNECGITDTRSIIKIIVTESNLVATGGDVITIGSKPPLNPAAPNAQIDRQVSLALTRHNAIHEVGHNLGLGDLYYSYFAYNGDPTRFYPLDKATTFPNTDVAGCPKWCASFKPVASYSTSECPRITDEQACRTHGRTTGRSCIESGNGDYQCCVWNPTNPAYFGSCQPAYGKEDIGINCNAGTGCYFGAVYGNDAWRPNQNRQESIMDSTGADKFDPVSTRWLDQIIQCCLTPNPTGQCAAVRTALATFQASHREFKQKIGTC